MRDWLDNLVLVVAFAAGTWWFRVAQGAARRKKLRALGQQGRET